MNFCVVTTLMMFWLCSGPGLRKDQVFAWNVCFCRHEHSWNSPEVSLKISSGLTLINISQTADAGLAALTGNSSTSTCSTWYFQEVINSYDTLKWMNQWSAKTFTVLETGLFFCFFYCKPLYNCALIYHSVSDIKMYQNLLFFQS